IITGYKCLMRSAEISMGDEFIDEESKFDKWIEKHFGKKAMGFIMGFSAVGGALLAIALFMVLPTFFVGIIDKFIPLGGFKALIEGAIKIAIFIIYIALVSKMKEIYRVFCYHGAEHKTIACFEANEELTVANVRKHTRFHPRCGTSFILIVLVVSILLFSLLPWTSTLVRAALKVLLLPLVMGIAYEIIRFAGKHNNPITRAVSAPGMWLQRLTTHEPEDSMIEVAIAAVKAVLKPEDLAALHSTENEETKIDSKEVDNSTKIESEEVENSTKIEE
ncbi:MAG: DUF1385 domain-containing protein, partial [Oscillospiraceae bacterium]